MPLVSFIIPYYNVPLPLVEQCVASVMRVGLEEGEREVIVVDDGSDADISRELSAVCRDLIYIRQTNGGLSAARNTGIWAARGEYIQFVDADDALVPDVYAQCVEKARATSADLLMFSHTSDAARHDDGVVWSGLTTGAQYLACNNLHPMAWGYLFRRRVLGDLRFFPGTYHEDEEFTPQLLIRVKSMFVTDAKAYFYRLREGSITTEKSSAHVEKRLDDVFRIINVLRGLSDTRQGIERDALRRRVAQLTMDYIYISALLLADWRRVAARVEKLRLAALYPLPAGNYTLAYSVFRLAANNAAGLRILSFLLPLVGRTR